MVEVTPDNLNVLDSSPLSSHRVLICWSADVRRVALHFPSSVRITDVTSLQHKPLYACAKENDTFLIGPKEIRNNGSQLLLTFSVDGNKGYTLRGFVDRRKHKHSRGQHRIIQYKYSSKTSTRVRRSTDTKRKKTEPAACGHTSSCYRYGEEDCGHMSCKYFLSYTVKASQLEIELSARAQGWVAVGFSSDRRMGGDEVVACAKTGKLASNVTAATYTNKYQYDPPERTDGPDVLTLEEYEVKDGYIYCRVSRPLSPPQLLDLTNDWYQLYTSGHVSTGGDLEKHREAPRISSKLTTTITTSNFYTSGSGIFKVSSMAQIVTIISIIIAMVT